MAKANPKIKVFQVIAENKLTGAPRVVMSLMRHLSDHRFEQYLVVSPGELADTVRRTFSKVTVLVVPMRGRSDLPAVRAINRLIVKYQPDIIHSHGTRAGLLARIGAFRMSVKTIHTEHTRTLRFALPNVLLEWAHRIGMVMLDVLNTDMNVAVSQSVADFLKRQVTKSEKITIIENGIEPLGKFDSKKISHELEQWGIDRKKDLVIGTIGSLNQAKNHKTLLEAFAKVAKSFPQAKLLIVGDGELRLFLRKLAEKLHIMDKVVFAGYQKEATDFLSAMDIFVLSSKSEAFGLSLLEAMQAKLPIVATKVGGIPEIIRHNHNGLLVSTGDTTALATTLNKLINDKKLQRKLISNYEATLAKFTAKKMADRYAELYEKIAQMPAIQSNSAS